MFSPAAFFVLLLCLVPCSLTAPANFPGEADRVDSLPDITFPIAYKHYSGYLNSVDGTKMHYWFFESQSSPAKDPVVLWLNGGPGCSSLYGAFAENGPIIMNINGSLTSNAYSWNQKANLLFLESPIGVGFSYKPGQSDFSNSDSKTVELNFGALRSFFAKFPHLADNRFYITGESYAGRYIPELSVVALKAKFPSNFQGVAIGNGYLDPSNALLNYFNYYHGLTDSLEGTGRSGGLNPYNILADCYETDYYARFISAAKFSQAKGTPDSVPCDGSISFANWVNQDKVKKAIHIDADWKGSWTICSPVNYNEDGPDTMADNVIKMVNSHLKVIIYNGDLDSVCNFVGDRSFTEKLGFKELSFDAWSTAEGIGGYRKQFEKNLTFTTVRGAGHMVPRDKPAAALKILNEFLLGISPVIA